MDKLTRHASVRRQQRGIAPFAIDLVIQFGRRERAGDGAVKVYLDKLGKRRLEAYFGSLAGKVIDEFDIYVVLSPDNHVITAAHRINRIKRH